MLVFIMFGSELSDTLYSFSSGFNCIDNHCIYGMLFETHFLYVFIKKGKEKYALIIQGLPVYFMHLV